MKIIQDPQLLKKLLIKSGLLQEIPSIEDYQLQLIGFEKQELLCCYQDPMANLLFLVEGQVEITRTLSNGNTVLYCFLENEGVLGTMELAENAPTFCDVWAMTNGYLIGIPMDPENNQKILDNHDLLLYLFHKQAVQMNFCVQRSAVNSICRLENRLASYLCHSAKDGFLNENLTRLAEHLGTSYRHLARNLRNFVQAGYLERCGDGSYRVTDLAALKELGRDVY